MTVVGTHYSKTGTIHKKTLIPLHQFGHSTNLVSFSNFIYLTWLSQMVWIKIDEKWRETKFKQIKLLCILNKFVESFLSITFLFLVISNWNLQDTVIILINAWAFIINTVLFTVRVGRLLEAWPFNDMLCILDGRLSVSHTVIILIIAHTLIIAHPLLFDEKISHFWPKLTKHAASNSGPPP